MKKIIFVCFFVALVFSFYSQLLSWIPAKWWTHKIAFAQIKDIYHPTLEDYRTIQKYLTKGKRPQLRYLNDMEKRCRNFKIIDKEPLQKGTIAINCQENEKENCLIVYASLNKSFPKVLRRLVEAVAKSDFKGHILYQVGGWPNVEAGDLSLVDVPYAFKVCFFREAKRLGYQRALWLDTSILPVVSLNQIFSMIEEDGYFVMGNNWMLQPFMNEKAANSFSITLKECEKIPSCSSGLFGVDFNHRAHVIVDEWYGAALDPYAFFSARSDQNALSIILAKLGFQKMAPLTTLIEGVDPITEESLFTIDRLLVHE